MGVVLFFLFIVVLGMAAGWVANMILGGGSRPANWTVLFIAGLIGSFVGGLIGSLIGGEGLELRPTGIIGSIVGAVIVLAVWNWVLGRSAAGQRR